MNRVDIQHIKKTVPCLAYVETGYIPGVETAVRREARNQVRYGRNGSLVVYPEKNTWYSHEANTGGSIIDLVMWAEGCDFETAVSRLGGWKPSPVATKPRKQTPKKSTKRDKTAPAYVPAPMQKRLELYPYEDIGGNVRFYRGRRLDWQPGAKFGKVVYYHEHNGRLAYGMGGEAHTLYRITKVLAADTVFIVEGEKDAHTLESWGYTATTNDGGAGKWPESKNHMFLGKTVYIVADNDDAGRKHGQLVANNLLPYAAAVKIVTLPGLQDKYDVTDWRDKHGGGVGQFQARIKAARDYDPNEDETQFAYRRWVEHSCKSGQMRGTIVTFYETAVKFAAYSDNDWRQCSACRYDYTERRVNQIVLHQTKGEDVYLKTMSKEDWQTLNAKWRKQLERNRAEYIEHETAVMVANGYTIDKELRKRIKAEAKQKITPHYSALPYETYLSGFCVLHTVEDEGGQKLPNKPDQLYAILDPIVEDATTQRVKSCGNWGYGAGWRGDGERRRKRSEVDKLLGRAVMEREQAGRVVTNDERAEIRAEIETAVNFEACKQYHANATPFKVAQAIASEVDRYGRGMKFNTEPVHEYLSMVDAGIVLKPVDNNVRNAISMAINASELIQEALAEYAAGIEPPPSYTQAELVTMSRLSPVKNAPGVGLKRDKIPDKRPFIPVPALDIDALVAEIPI